MSHLGVSTGFVVAIPLQMSPLNSLCPTNIDVNVCATLYYIRQTCFQRICLGTLLHAHKIKNSPSGTFPDTDRSNSEASTQLWPVKVDHPGQYRHAWACLGLSALHSANLWRNNRRPRPSHARSSGSKIDPPHIVQFVKESMIELYDSVLAALHRLCGYHQSIEAGVCAWASP